MFRSEPRDLELPGDGLRLHALDWGPAPGPTLIFLHGGGLNAHTWDVVCDVLHDRFRCLAIDLRGHGDSPWHEAGDYSLQAHIADLSHALEALAPGRPFGLVGMSLGGIVALGYAGSRDPGPDALVIVDTGPNGSRTDGRKRVNAFLDGPGEFASIEDIVDRAMAFNPRRSRERLRRTLRNNVRQTARGTWVWKYDPRIRRPFNDRSLSPEEIEHQLSERRRSLWAAAATISCPTLVVRGAESDMFLDKDAEQAAAAFPDGKWLRIGGASHTVQSDRPHELASSLEEFLRQPFASFGDIETRRD